MDNIEGAETKADAAARRRLMSRFWRTASGFWGKSGDRRAWLLTGALVAILFIQLFVQYRVNVWNRDVFNALEQKDSGAVLTQVLIYLPLLGASVITAVAGIYCRMTTQQVLRRWGSNDASERCRLNGRS